MQVLYLIGQPGAGKTTLMNALTGRAHGEQYDKPVPHVAYWQQTGKPGWFAAQLGRARAEFSGTDALAMNVIGRAIGFLDAHPYPHILGEGDRLANDRFFEAVRDAGGELTVIHLTVPTSVAQARRDARGSAQDPAWVKGRASKAEALAEKWASATIDGELPVEEQVEALKAASPTAAQFA